MNTQPNDDFAKPESSARHHDHRWTGTRPWIGGAILIALGMIMLLQNATGFALTNWWALFILIPAVGAFDRTWQNYQDAGRRMTTEVRKAMFGGVILTLVAAIFLFNLSWTLFGPVLLILAGAGLLLTSLFPE